MADCPQVTPGSPSLRPRADSLSGEARPLQGGLDAGETPTQHTVVHPEKDASGRADCGQGQATQQQLVLGASPQGHTPAPSGIFFHSRTLWGPILRPWSREWDTPSGKPSGPQPINLLSFKSR